MSTVLALTGSVVEHCFVARLVGSAATALRTRGLHVEEIAADGLDLPLFSFPRERRDGLPADARRLHEALAASDAVVVGAPELNGTFTGTLRNALDWAARPAAPGEELAAAFAGLPAAIVTASKHAHAGLRGGEHLRGVLASLGCVVLPQQLAVPFAQRHFGADGRLADVTVERDLELVVAGAAAAAAVGRRLAGPRPAWQDSLTPSEAAA